MKPDVSLDFQFTSSIEQVWSSLTDLDMLAKWIWDNNFKPIVGYKFQFRAEPSEWWDGIVDGEVLEVDEPHKLSYTWVSAGETTTVTWTLSKGADETIHLHLDQTGFSEATKAREGAIVGAKYGWTNMGQKLEKVFAEL
ncbi:SRPBCC family protein [Psychrobacillus sp. L4]|uniref:SRPBCC family protein n=1 Tax=Psychrobacillus sp. L4 TaxID=3236892 RepID=UPI0036F432DC